MKIPAKALPDNLKRVLKGYGFNRREIGVEIKPEDKVYGNTHAPEYDNFDYSYALLFNLGNGTTNNLQAGLAPNDSKSVSLTKNEVLIDGDKHSHFATLVMSQETFDQNFKPETKAAMSRVHAEIKELEMKLGASVGQYFEELEDGIKKIEDAIKHLNKSDAVKKMKEDLEHLQKDHQKFMVELMDQVEPL